jgi:hypothetical protein
MNESKPMEQISIPFVAVEVRTVELDEHAQPIRPVTDTVRYDDFVRLLFKADTEPMMALHIAVGLAGEVGEFFEAPLGSENEEEELGDLEFYLQAYCNHYNIVPVYKVTGEATELSIVVGDICDLIKREYIYKKLRDLAKAYQLYATMRVTLDAHYEALGISRQEILQLNANKLAQRYAGLRYTDEAAIARADKKGKEN